MTRSPAHQQKLAARPTATLEADGRSVAGAVSEVNGGNRRSGRGPERSARSAASGLPAVLGHPRMQGQQKVRRV